MLQLFGNGTRCAELKKAEGENGGGCENYGNCEKSGACENYVWNFGGGGDYEKKCVNIREEYESWGSRLDSCVT